jgi:hydrogenase expression/formation protein HypC
MCLGIPVQIKEIKGDSGIVELSGVQREASLILVPQAKVGDWVILHAGFAIQILDEAEAKETLRLLEELAQLDVGAVSK